MIITNFPQISAIYFALLQCGYNYYAQERSQEHCDKVCKYTNCCEVPLFFSRIRQNTCEVYPYWPRAAMLESASFYLSPDFSQFRDYEAFRKNIMSAGNIADNERDQNLWDWIAEFPTSLSKILSGDAFHRYLNWENEWIAEQNTYYETELQQLQSFLNICVEKYCSPIKDIQIVLNPIKCVYSADYHLNGDCFIYSSGAFRIESALHEFLHHVVHPAVLEMRELILKNVRTYPNIDTSYYLEHNAAGQLNAFEEYAVRNLTKEVLTENNPTDLAMYLKSLL